MNSRTTLLLLPALLLVLVISAAISSTRATASSDMPPGRRTAAPGEGTCDGCHDGGLNDGVGTLLIQNVPASYLPGQTYTITVSLARGGSMRWGFELTSLQTSSGNMAGTLVNTTAYTGTQTVASKVYISQTTATLDGSFAGTANGPVTWSFDWIAPAVGTGSVTFYAGAVAADNSGDPDAGDFVYTATAASSEGTSIDVKEMTWGAIKAMYR